MRFKDIKDDEERGRIMYLFPFIVPTLDYEELKVNGKLMAVFDTAHNCTSFFEANEINKLNPKLSLDAHMTQDEAREADIKECRNIINDDMALKDFSIRIFNLIKNPEIKKQAIKELL